MLLDTGIGRVLKLIVVGLMVEVFLGDMDPVIRFPAVFLSVCLADSLPRVLGKEAKTLYFEDVFATILAYLAFGLLAYGFDIFIHGYTGKHAGPVIPAVALAVLDRAWQTNGLSRQRR